MSEPPDPRLAKYRLGRVLGSGGMGEVWLARDIELNRDVAIKFISADHVSDPESRQRLVREAQAAAALDHPAICAVYEVHAADTGATPFIVMQYVEGETLAARLRRGPLDAHEALTLAARIADALAEANRHGVVHRDLKPENVMITPSGRPKLLDFGIARVATLAGYEAAETQAGITREGTFIGTPSYMSPEHIEQRVLDGRSDLFSLGCVLSECLTGRAAFTGRTAIEICAAVLHVQPALPSAVRPELTTRYDELCRRLLAKHPDDRFQTADEVVGAIRVLLPDATLPAASTGPVAAPRRRRVLRVGAIAAVLAAVASLGVWQWSRTRGGATLSPDAERWYVLGVDHLRNAAYLSASRAFKEALGVSGGYAPAYTRLAEAHIELDEESEAKDALLNVDRATLRAEDRLRYDAVNALATGKPDAAVAGYRQLTGRAPSDPGAWVDLGRAQQAAGLSADARASFERALEIDGRSAAAHLHMGILAAITLRRDQALQRFAEAEGLYEKAANAEGQTEAVLRRGLFLASGNELQEARAALGQASTRAKLNSSTSQRIRADIGLATVTASEGDLTRAEADATAAVNQALEARLDTVAANGLIDLAVVLMRKQESDRAQRLLEKAVDLSERRRAPRTSIRARLQLASCLLGQQKSAQALTAVEAMLPALRTRGYRRWEMDALAIASRAHEDVGEFARARALALESLAIAEGLGDDGQLAVALDNLAAQLLALGFFPEALAYRERGEAIHRRQKDNARLSFDLQNRAELLIRLGRGAEAEAPLEELDAGAAAGIEVFAQRARRVRQLRALRATVEERFDRAARFAFEAVRASSGKTDSTTVLSVALLDHAIARGAVAPGTWSRPADTPTLSNAHTRELRYWQMATASARGDHRAALTSATNTLTEFATSLSMEDRWRIAATAAVAARALGDTAQAATLQKTASATVGELIVAWKADADTYLKRADLVRLKERAELIATPR